MISNNPHINHKDEAVIEIANLSKSFGTQEVLKDVSLKLFNGENLVVLGKSGSGKSVLIKCIVRLLQLDGGTINAFGQDIMQLDREELNEVRKRIGFLFQGGALYDSMTVEENLDFHLKRIKKRIHKKRKRRKDCRGIGECRTPRFNEQNAFRTFRWNEKKNKLGSNHCC